MSQNESEFTLSGVATDARTLIKHFGHQDEVVNIGVERRLSEELEKLDTRAIMAIDKALGDTVDINMTGYKTGSGSLHDGMQAMRARSVFRRSVLDLPKRRRLQEAVKGLQQVWNHRAFLTKKGQAALAAEDPEDMQEGFLQDIETAKTFIARASGKLRKKKPLDKFVKGQIDAFQAGCEMTMSASKG